MEGFALDLKLWTPQLKNKTLTSIYFGGGTPSLLSPDAIHTLIESVYAVIPFNRNEIEITLEANPETLTLDKMKAYAQVGVNRISVGIQSLDDKLLSKLGRTHNASTAIKAIDTIVLAGISNISIDLMYDIPMQTLSTWRETLKQASKLPVTHLSLYNLTIEPHTTFFKYQESLQKELPDAECSTEMYKEAVDILQDAGLIQYEISAFARNGAISKHNTGYWTGRPFLGFGPSAFSYWEGKRFRATANLNRYVQALRENKSPIDFTEELDQLPHQRELLAIALRMIKGVDIDDFQQQQGRLPESTLNALMRLQEDHYLTKNQNTLALTQKGILFYDTVAVELI